MKVRLLILLLFVGLLSPVGAVVNPVKPTETEKEAAIREEVRQYREELKAMSGKERRALKRQQRKAAKAAAREMKASGDIDMALMVVLAILLPPLAVYIHEGYTTNRFWISILLTLLFWLPGVIYALLVILE